MELTKSWWLHSINAVLQYDFTNLRNFSLLSARCIYLLFWKTYAIKSVCVRVSTATLLTKTKSYENVDISVSEQPYSVRKWKTRLEEVTGIQGIFARVIKRPPLLIIISFVCYLRQLYFARSSFSYSLKSSSAMEKLGLWRLDKCLR